MESEGLGYSLKLRVQKCVSLKQVCLCMYSWACICMYICVCARVCVCARARVRVFMDAVLKVSFIPKKLWLLAGMCLTSAVQGCSLWEWGTAEVTAQLHSTQHSTGLTLLKASIFFPHAPKKHRMFSNILSVTLCNCDSLGWRPWSQYHCYLRMWTKINQLT